VSEPANSATRPSDTSGYRDTPVVKGDGRIVFRGRWAALSEAQEGLARVLSDQLGEVVDVGALAAAYSAAGEPMTRGAVRIHIMHLRKRIGPLGLAVRTIRRRGYLMEEDEESTA